MSTRTRWAVWLIALMLAVNLVVAFFSEYLAVMHAHM